MNTQYLDTLLLYYEEEIMGEAYFYGLIEHFHQPHEQKKIKLLAEIERFAANSVRPLIDKYQLHPRPDKALKIIGEEGARRHAPYEWGAFIKDIVTRYPGYLDEFAALEHMAPDEDLPPLKILTEHEVAVIEFAHRDIDGRSDCMVPLEEYLSLRMT